MTAGAIAPDHSANATSSRSVLGWLIGRLASLARFLIGVILCLTPVTAIVVLGWLMRLMQSETGAARARLEGSRHARTRLPRWVVAEVGNGRTTAETWLGSLVENLTLGVRAFVAIALSTLPFTALWLLSWWAGWENSFNKGYEQAWVGPTVGLIGVAIALPLLARMPMALAHQAAENGRVGAFFAWGHVWRLMRAVRWRYAGLCVFFVAAALPVFALNGLPVFVEHWRPGFAERSPEAIAAFATSYHFWATACVLAALIFLRRASARLYARATVALDQPLQRASLRAKLATALVTVTVLLLWFEFVAGIFVGQFVNHHWVSWLTHPMFALPWLPPPGVAM